MNAGKKIAPASNAAPRAPAIPFPPDLSVIVAEEARPTPHFTPRELQVAGWMAEGKTDSEIARILTLGLQTVKTHVKSVLHKTDLENRNAFIAWAWRDRMAAAMQGETRPGPVKYG
ncbi:MAG: helix-turn-helix transcriptional regulator [Chthoniobacterales bacterium]